MKGLKFYRTSQVEKLIGKRSGETKFGERLQFVEDIDELRSHSAKYVVLGIPEDIGVRANHGQPGAAGAWESFLKAFVNIQVNRFNNPEQVILLGRLDCQDLMLKASNIDTDDPNYLIKLGDLVKQIDQLLGDIIQRIIENGKVPIVIGGGHNNAYGNIKGASKALNDPINVINIDAHTDLRQLEHRHSGNGFSYAIEGQYLNKYTIFGLHMNYTPEYIFNEMDYSDNIQYHFAEDLLRFPDEINRRFVACLDAFHEKSFGLELDCDAIAGFPSSAKSPAGFSINQVRNLVQIVAKNPNCKYFHVCEAAPDAGSSAEVGKALSYFVSDFISA